MTEPKWQELQIFKAKITAYLDTHRKTVDEFERSLRNARHFIDLARVAREKEPDDAVALLEQIQEIDLPGHLASQYDAFLEISDLLPEEADSQETLEAQADVEDLRGRYEKLLEESEQQQKSIREILDDLERTA